jgi:hypothetical protein
MTTTATGDVVTEAGSPDSFELSRNAERTLLHRIIIGVAIAVPLSIGLWVGLIALAVGHASAGTIGMAIGIGVLNGVFFGTWAGFVATTDAIDQLETDSDGHHGDAP